MMMKFQDTKDKEKILLTLTEKKLFKKIFIYLF